MLIVARLVRLNKTGLHKEYLVESLYKFEAK